jgi:hypothetical protein
MTTHAHLVSTGRYLPEIEVSNDALRARFDAALPEFVDKMERGRASAALARAGDWPRPPTWRCRRPARPSSAPA